MTHGNVKWFSNVRGIGFLTSPEVGEDVFIHYSAIDMDGYRSLKAGESVQFTFARGPKGLCATRIQRVVHD